MLRNTFILTISILFLLCAHNNAIAQQAPEAPPSLSASPIFASKAIKLTWQAPSTADAATYNIYRSTSSSSAGERIYIVSSSSLEYTDTDISYNTTYYYRITAEKADMESDYSNTASSETTLLVPVNVSAADIDAKIAIRVAWDSPAPGLLLWYDVYRSTTQSSNGTRIKTKINATEFEDADLKHDTIYYYRVRSVSEDNTRSEYSDQARAKAVAEYDTFEPTNIKTAILSNNGVRVSWSAPKYVDTTSYLVYRSTSETDLGSLRAEVSKLSFSEYALEAGSEFYYKVKAVLEDGTISKASSSAKASIKKSGEEEGLVPPVTELSAIGTGKSGEIKLTWKKPFSQDFSYVRVYRGTKSESGKSLAADKVKGASFTDKKLDNGFTYYYIIRTVSKKGVQGAQSDEASGAPFIKQKKDQTPSKVSKLRAQDMGDGKTIKLSWNNPASYEYSYIKIYRSAEKGKIGNPIRNRLRSDYYNDADVTSSQRYYYTVKTINVNGVESENNITVKGVATTALEGEGGLNDADKDGLPDSWERKYGFNAHLKDLISEDDDNDGLNSFEEYEQGTDPYDPDSDSDGYSDGTEVANDYNPLGAGRRAQVKEITKKAIKGNFAYKRKRLPSFLDESNLAVELRSLLEYEFGKGKIPNPRSHWPKLVNAYVYGGYTSQEIAHTLRFGPGLVHPSVEASVWRNSDEYKRKQ